MFNSQNISAHAQPVFTCSNSTMETPQNLWNLFKTNNFQCQWTSKRWLGGLFNLLDISTYFEIYELLFKCIFDCFKRWPVQCHIAPSIIKERRAECFRYTLIGQKGQLNCSTNLQSFIELGSISICTVASSTNHKPNYATYQQSSFVVFHHFIASLWCLERENCSYIFVVIFFLIILEVIKSEQQKADAVNTPKTKYKNQPKSCL